MKLPTGCDHQWNYTSIAISWCYHGASVCSASMVPPQCFRRAFMAPPWCFSGGVCTFLAFLWRLCGASMVFTPICRATERLRTPAGCSSAGLPSARRAILREISHRCVRLAWFPSWRSYCMMFTPVCRPTGASTPASVRQSVCRR